MPAWQATAAFSNASPGGQADKVAATLPAEIRALWPSAEQREPAREKAPADG